VESRYTEAAGKWSRDFQEFARYFSAQLILGTFTNWKIYCSEPRIAAQTILWNHLIISLRNPTPCIPGTFYWH
jgi:hypothetical protein